MTYTKDTIVFEPIPTRRSFIDLTGQLRDRLTILGYAGKWGHAQGWWCECSCGKICKVRGYELKHQRSCGCLAIELLRSRSITHGETLQAKWSTEYGIYAAAKQRCTDPNRPAFKDYGGRGIEFRFTSFEHFLETVGRRPSRKHSINRKDNDGHYEPGNVSWVTKTEQARNVRTNKLLAIGDKTLCIAAWSEASGISQGTVGARLRRNWCGQCAVTLPVGSSCPHR